MRLLNVFTREFEEFQGSNIPQYAILSHTWGPEEITLHEMEAISRYHAPHHASATHMVPRSSHDPDAMKLMLLSTMLMAFRRQRPRLALTTGDGTEESDHSYSFNPVVPASSPHHFEAKAGFSKIACACGQAEKDGYRYLWVDTCCIDQKSSAEVSEAINSMFTWYQRAAVCYAFLEDVHFDDYTEGYLTWKDHFSNSRWFTRGWTLQELLAPKKVVFYARGWRLLGTKSSLVRVVEKITGIDELTLLEPRLIHRASVAQRMSWAARRATTRTEDLAYSLMGLFGVNMPILYGEGESAFLRLQEEIIKRSDDHSIFAWGALNHSHASHPPDLDDFDPEDATGTVGILATSHRDFLGMEHIVASPPTRQQEEASAYTLTNKGLHISLSLTTANPSHGTTSTPSQTQTHQLAILNCHPAHDPNTRLAFLLTPTQTPNVFLRTHTRTATTTALLSAAISPKPTWIYIPATPSQLPVSRDLSDDEVVVIRMPDLVAPGYSVVDIQGPPEKVQWNGELGMLRVSGVVWNAPDKNMRRRCGVLWQLAVVTIWNGHAGCGFVMRVLVEGVSKVVFVDLVPVPAVLQRARVDGEGEGLLVEEAKRVWENPGVVEVSVPGLKGSSEGRSTIQVEVVDPASGGEQEQKMGWKHGVGEQEWSLKPGHEVKVAESVTFAEHWEREYRRTVNAKVARKKRGVIELSLSSMLWQTVST